MLIVGSNLFEPKDTRRRPNGSVLEPARHPISATGDLTNQPGHDLALGIDHHSRSEKCSPASGSVTSVARPTDQTRQRHADQSPLGVLAAIVGIAFLVLTSLRTAVGVLLLVAAVALLIANLRAYLGRR